MRIPYAPSEPADPHPDTSAIYDRIKARRHPRPLIPLDLALLHNPKIADGFNTLLGAIRTESSLSPALMELAICYVAVLNNATYEWTAHAPLALKAGVHRSKLQALLRDAISTGVSDLEIFTGEEVAVLEFTYHSTEEIKVPDQVIAKLKELFTDQQIMELTITVGAYNMVSRFLVALDVTESNGKRMEMPSE